VCNGVEPPAALICISCAMRLQPDFVPWPPQQIQEVAALLRTGSWIPPHAMCRVIAALLLLAHRLRRGRSPGLVPPASTALQSAASRNGRIAELQCARGRATFLLHCTVALEQWQRPDAYGVLSPSFASARRPLHLCSQCTRSTAVTHCTTRVHIERIRGRVSERSETERASRSSGPRALLYVTCQVFTGSSKFI
jgi:hypothetical protein